MNNDIRAQAMTDRLIETLDAVKNDCNERAIRGIVPLSATTWAKINDTLAMVKCADDIPGVIDRPTLAKAYAEGLEDAAKKAYEIDASWQEKEYEITYNRKRYMVAQVLGMVRKALNIQSEDAAEAIRALPNKYEVKK